MTSLVVRMERKKENFLFSTVTKVDLGSTSEIGMSKMVSYLAGWVSCETEGHMSFNSKTNQL